MCVIAWAWKAHPRWPLVVLANRDEQYKRASAPLDWWRTTPAVLAGRDLEAGGTWLGVTRAGRFAAITNRGGTKPPGAPSRGELVTECLTATTAVPGSMAEIDTRARRYAGFNLLAGDGHELVFASNRQSRRVLEPGIHGMANGALDEPIPKVERLKQTLSEWAGKSPEPDTQTWLALLADATPADDEPRSAVFVRGVEYGTRSSSIVAFGADRSVLFIERGFDAEGMARDTHHFEFKREA